MSIKWIQFEGKEPVDPKYKKLYMEGKLDIGLGKEETPKIEHHSKGFENHNNSSLNHLEDKSGLSVSSPKNTIDKDTPLGRFL